MPDHSRSRPRLYYVHDPMCSWCWGFRPVWQQVQQQLPEDIEVHYLLGGLAPDSDAPMPDDLQQTLQNIWHRIQQQIPGTTFNFDFWSKCRPRRSTWPACRAVIAAKACDPAAEQAMILAIQQAYYLHARNPSDDATLIDLAAAIGLDSSCFSKHFHANETRQELQRQIETGRQLGLRSFPSLMLQHQGNEKRITIDYHSATAIINQLSL